MSPQPSWLQWLVVFIPVVLLWSPSFRVQGQAIAKCWVFSPVVDESTIRAEVSTLSLMEASTGRRLWSVSARVTWAKPTSLGSDGAYAISVLRLPSFKTPKFCTMEANEHSIATEEFTFTGLDFGFLYEFTVYVLNGTTMAKSLVGISKGFGTPDCFQATGDRDFCINVAVQYAGAPIEPRLDSECVQEDSLVTAHLSWDPPIQINGDISAYKLQYTPPDTPPGTPAKMVTAIPGPEGRVTANLIDMTPGSSYTVLISTYVISREDGSFNEGLQVELKFRIAGATGRLSVCPSPPPTTMNGVGLNSLQTTTFYNPATATPAETSNRLPSQTTSGVNPATTTVAPPSKTTKPPPRRPDPPTHAPGQTTLPTSTTEGEEVGERPVASSKKAGIAIAACLVALGIVCAVAMVILHIVRGRIADKSTARPDTKGAQKGKTTGPSPA